MILHVYICVVDVKLSTMSEHVEYVTQCVNFYPRDARHQSHCITCYTVFIVIFIFLFCRSRCVCPDQYAGSDCSQCANGRWGTHCLLCPACVHGLCNSDTGTFVYVCFWLGLRMYRPKI